MNVDQLCQIESRPFHAFDSFAMMHHLLLGSDTNGQFDLRKLDLGDAAETLNTIKFASGMPPGESGGRSSSPKFPERHSAGDKVQDLGRIFAENAEVKIASASGSAKLCFLGPMVDR